MRKHSQATFISVNTPNYGLKKINSHLLLLAIMNKTDVLYCCFVPTKA